MVIQSSNVNLASSRNYGKKVRESQAVTEWQAANPKNSRSYTTNFSLDYEESSMYNNYGDFARNLKNSQAEKNIQSNEGFGVPLTNVQNQNTMESYWESTHKIFQSLLELLYKSRGVPQRERQNGWFSNSLDLTTRAGSTEGTLLASSTWNRVTQTHYFMEERETTMFSGTGTAVTADGRKLEFGVSFAMSSSFMQEFELETMEQYERVLTDPLVINLDCAPTQLSDQTFLFDIDGDGEKEELSMLLNGSGFLALDLNEDGKINDGNELFGTKSGNGFADLAKYDKDGNGWIDEADEIYSKLRVWVRNENGEDKLMTLKEADVGAIYLGSSAGDFRLRGTEGLTNGIIRSSGLFLHENGLAGTVQQLDLANHEVSC